MISTVTLTLVVMVALGLWAGLAFRKHRNLRNNRPTLTERQGLFFQSSMGEIFYSRHGQLNKPTLVFLHGIGGSGYSWRLLIPELENNFHIVNIDLWGFGRSVKSPKIEARLEVHQIVVGELLEVLEVESYSLVGCSMGGALALWLASAKVLPIDRVVVLAPAAGRGLVPKLTRRLGWLTHLTPTLINPAFMTRVLKSIYAKGTPIPAESVQAYLRPYSEKASHKTFSNHLRLIEDPRIFDGLKDISAATMLLYGKGDRIVPYRIVQGVLQQVPSVILHEHPTSGHHLMEEDPQWCAHFIREFFET